MPPFLAALELNTEAFKYTLLAVTSPFWWPFVRELWREFNDILAEEGGLFGRQPTEKEIAEIRKARAEREAALVNELREQARSGRGKRRAAAAAGRAFGTSTLRRPGTGAGNGSTPARKGFGPPR
jgi:hypothetical protein